MAISHELDLENMVEFVQDMVRLPSLSGEEAAVAQRVEAEMRSLGFDEVWTDENGSVVGVINGQRDDPATGKTLLFDAHTDTVGVTSGTPWARDPFSGTTAEGAIFGRGSADMKGALAAMIHAAAGLDRAKIRGRLVVSASTLEEVLEGVALRTVMQKNQPDLVVIGEPSSLNLVRGGRGRAEVHLETIGRPSHSSSPHLGRNAVLDMMRAIEAVEAIELPSHELMGPAIFALTDIISDPYPGHSVIPSICRATYDRRTLPGESAQDVLNAITAAKTLGDIQLNATIGMGNYTAYTGLRLEQEKFFPAWLFSEDEWFIRQTLAGLTQAGLAPELTAYRFCTNAAYSAGVAGVPTVGFGPANEWDAHVIDERLSLDDLFAAARGYTGIAEAILA